MNWEALLQSVQEFGIQVWNLVVPVINMFLASPYVVGGTLGVLVGVGWTLGLVMPFLANRADKRVLESQNRFAALASHYLITPVSVIQAAVARLQEAEALQAGERERLYESVERGQQRLWITAQQLLTMYDLSINALKVKRDPVNLPELITRTITNLDVFARERKVAVVFVNQVDNDTQIRADGKYLAMTFAAILDNAIKFSPEGSKVVVALEAKQAGLVVAVRDNGAGIPADVVKHLGERIERGGELYTFDHEGIGLGLFLATRLAERQGAVLKVYSKVKQGAQVEITFPT